MHIDHTTLRTTNIEATRDFFLTVFDLTIGKRPENIERSIPGYWLYADGNPIVHIIKADIRFHQSKNSATEEIDHTAFFMSGFSEFKSKLDKLGIEYSLMELKDIDEKRIFLHTPTGILLETVFRHE